MLIPRTQSILRSQDYEYDLTEPSSKKNVLYILRLKVNSVTYYLYTRSFGYKIFGYKVVTNKSHFAVKSSVRDSSVQCEILNSTVQPEILESPALPDNMDSTLNESTSAESLNSLFFNLNT